MKVLSYRAENIKRLKVVEIQPKGSLVRIGGANEQGKSSALDAIEMALSGEGAIPPKPIRDGEDHASVELDLGDIIVRRTFTPKGTSLVVENKDGARFASPQAMLNNLIDRKSFDPLLFVTMDGPKQVDVLKQLAGLDFTDLDGRRAKVYELRTERGRLQKQLEAQLKSTPEIVDPPSEPVSIEQLTADMAAADTAAETYAQAAAAVLQAESFLAMKTQTLTTTEKRVRELEKELETAKAAVSRATTEAHKAEKALAAKREESATAEKAVPDRAALRDRLNSATLTNKQFESAQARAQLVRQLAAYADDVQDLTVDIGEIDAEKQTRIKNAAFPLEGLGIDDSGVTFDGIPLSQASQAAKIRIGVAIGVALNPKVPVFLVRNGSLLDEDSQALLEQLAEENGAQVWMEVVEKDAGKVQVLIEDGAVKGQVVQAKPRNGRVAKSKLTEAVPA